MGFSIFKKAPSDSIFSPASKGDLEDVKHAIELLDTRTVRLQKAQRAASGAMAGFQRRLRGIEMFLKATAPTDAAEVEEEEEDDLEETEDDVSRETQRLRLGRG